MAVANLSPTTRVWLENQNFTQTTHLANTGQIGEWGRAAAIGYTDETILQFNLSSLAGATVTAVTLDITCNTAGSQTLSATATVWEQDKTTPGSWSSPPEFDDFAQTDWTNALSTQTVQATGSYNFATSAAFVTLIQSWIDDSNDNWGIIVEAEFAAVGCYLSLDSATLNVTYTSPAPDHTSQVYTTTGSSVFNVPAGVSSITVKSWGGGAGGAAGGTSGVGGSGGGGGYVQGTIAVTPGEQLDIHVGGKGELGAYPGANSGGGGGGAGRCSVFRGSTPLFTAGAGGGGGGGDNSSTTAGGAGGAGGGTTGGSGGNSSSSIGAGGGTQTTGGSGGTGGANVGVAGEDYDGSPAGGGGDGADGTTGSSKGGQDNGGITNGGAGGTGNITAGYAGGGGGGSGRAGGGGGASSVASDAGGSGGGGGSNYIDSGATSQTNSQASGLNPPNTGDDDYQASAGVGGAGGATSTNGSDGNDGRIVILWAGATFYYGMQFFSSSSEYLESVTTLTPPSLTGSVATWMYLYDNPGAAIQRVMGTEGSWEMLFGTGSPGTLTNDLNGVGSFNSNTVFQANRPYHVVCTYGSDTGFQECLTFDGTNESFIATGYNGITGTAARSFELLVKTTTSASHRILSYGANSLGQYWQMEIAGGRLRVDINGGQASGNATGLNDGEWHRVGCTVVASANATNIKIYADGVDTGLNSSASYTINTSAVNDVRIGANTYSTTTEPFDGLIDDVRIWSDVRTPAEMLDYAWVELNGDEDNLDAYWQMNETSGTAVPDLSPNNRDATTVNMDDTNWVASLGATGNGRIIIDGVLDSTGTNQSGTPGSDNLRLGHVTDATDEYFNGLLEDVRIYDRVLTDGECATIHACKGTDGITYGLLHRWTLDAGPMDTQVSDTTGIIKDLGIDSNNMTPVNSPTFRGTMKKYRRFG